MSRGVRIAGTVVLTAAAVAYLAWKVDVSETVDVLAETDLAWFALAAGIMIGTVPALALRWQLLLRAHGIDERLRWLTRAYFVGYAAGQVLPTAIGGDAVRVVETVRRHPGRAADVTGTVVLERGIGAAATVVLGAVAFVLALGRYDVSAYVWIEGVLALGTIALGFVFFARSARPLLRALEPLLRAIRLDRALRAFYESVHHFRGRTGLLLGLGALMLAVQAVRILAVWACGKAAGVDLGVLAYYVMGPLLFLVMLVPFTLNGIAVREAFFVSFLGTLAIEPEPAFAAGFLFFLVSVLMAVPGGAILAWEGIRGGARPRVEHG